MRIVCYWHRRQLERILVMEGLIPPDSLLGRHLASCPDCAQARRDLTALQAILPSVSPQPTVSADFGERLRSRIHAERESLASAPFGANSPRWRDFGSMPIPRLALAAAMAVGLCLWNPRSGPEIVPRIIRKHTVPDVVAISPHRKPTGSMPRTTSFDLRTILPSTWDQFAFGNYAGHGRDPLRAPYGAGHRRDGRIIGGAALVQHLTHRGRSPRTLFALAGHAVTTRYHFVDPPMPPRLTMNTSGPAADNERVASNGGARSVEISFVATTWSDSAAVFSALGDHTRAEQAYGRAFEQSRDADLAAAAGEQAVSAGDMSRSLEYCALALR